MKLHVAMNLSVLCVALAAQSEILVASFLPNDFLRDGSVSYQREIQQALDAVPEAGATVRFPEVTLLIDDPGGLRVRSRTRLDLSNTRLLAAPNIDADGQVFLIEDGIEIAFHGGEIRGSREAWDPGVNVAGIRVRGMSAHLRFESMVFVSLSSNGIGIFATNAEAMIRDVQLHDVKITNCCNYYGDYLSDAKGPAPGSDREDQGGVAFYHVEDWVVADSRFQGSQSDGTHFYQSSNGRFVNNIVCDSQMGGYFLEGCTHVLASGNIMARNGSRGVTIERDSRHCTLVNNIIEYSGREGLWAPDVADIIVADNIFRENGRKDDGARDAEIRLDDEERYATRTGDILIRDNLFCTTASQDAALRLGAGVAEVDMHGNTYRGAAAEVLREEE